MCGRFYVDEETGSPVIREPIEALAEKGISVKTGEVCPGDIAAVLANNRRLVPQAFAMNWGFPLQNKLVFNTRSETVLEKPMFRACMQKHRCLIPASYYFEWERKEKEKTKYAISPAGSEALYLAGIYRIEGGRAVFSVLTKAPADSIAFIHDRMPVILPEGAAKDWFDLRYDGSEVLKAAERDMCFRAV